MRVGFLFRASVAGLSAAPSWHAGLSDRLALLWREHLRPAADRLRQVRIAHIVALLGRVRALDVRTAVGRLRLPDRRQRPDAELLALGREFDRLAGELHRTGWKDPETVARFDAVEGAILEREPTSAAGLAVKARAVSWALLDDLDPSREPTADKMIATTVIRDVIRVHGRRLEEQAALMKLASLLLSV